MIIDGSKSDGDYCSVCSKEEVYKFLKGETNCHYCGNEINLCENCFFDLKMEFSKYRRELKINNAKVGKIIQAWIDNAASQGIIENGNS